MNEDLVDKGIGIAVKIASLPTAVILVIVCGCMGYYIYKKMKLDKEDSENWRKTREEGVRAEEHQTEVLRQLVDVTAANTTMLNSHSGEIREIRTILNERLPGGRNGTA